MTTHTTELEALASQAKSIMDSMGWDLANEHGIEIEEGWFNLFNGYTGQSKTVLLNLATDMVFKNTYTDEPTTASGRYLGDVTWEGVTYPVRLPKLYRFGEIIVQEYVRGESDDCGSSWCRHASSLRTVTKCNDTHTGNWKIYNGEVVLFDFEGITL